MPQTTEPGFSLTLDLSDEAALTLAAALNAGAKVLMAEAKTNLNAAEKAVGKLPATASAHQIRVVRLLMEKGSAYKEQAMVLNNLVGVLLELAEGCTPEHPCPECAEQVADEEAAIKAAEALLNGGWGETAERDDA